MNKLRKKIKRLFQILWNAILCMKERVTHPHAAYWVLTPEHGNLGDHAIAQSEQIMFRKLGISVIEVTGKELLRRQRLHLLKLMNGRPILVHGGGFLGTIWFDAEVLLRDVIAKNHRSGILLLPNTVFYENTEHGQQELKKSEEIYNAHPNLEIFLREPLSYRFAKQHYRNVSLVPDMVMLQNRSDAVAQRSGCLLCLRGDHERTRSAEDEATIRECVARRFGENVFNRDMVVDYPIPTAARDQELDRQYRAFRSAELVVTDRLHGMVFSAVTGTPCVVIDSMSPKVRGCYEWLSHLDYIRFCDDIAHFPELCDSLPKGGRAYDNADLLSRFAPLEDAILRVVGKKTGNKT